MLIAASVDRTVVGFFAKRTLQKVLTTESFKKYYLLITGGDIKIIGGSEKKDIENDITKIFNSGV